MSQKRLILSSPLLEIMTSRLCQQLIENHQDFSDTIILGLQPRGVYFSNRVMQELGKNSIDNVQSGYLDATFYRDDFRRRDAPLVPSNTNIPFLIEKKKVVLIDDVMATGRMVRAAMDAMISFGRPSQVELMVLVDRLHHRDFPLKPTYFGIKVNTLDTQHVQVEWKEQGFSADRIWLVS